MMAARFNQFARGYPQRQSIDLDLNPNPNAVESFVQQDIRQQLSPNGVRPDNYFSMLPQSTAAAVVSSYVSQAPDLDFSFVFSGNTPMHNGNALRGGGQDSTE
jgi:hypothetical protein